jgi:hypothetical protein
MDGDLGTIVILIIVGGLCVWAYLRSYQRGKTTSEQLQGEKYSPHQNRFAARGEAKASIARGENLAALNAESALMRADELAKKEHHLQILLVERAEKQGLSVEWYQHILGRRELDKLELKKLEEEVLVKLKGGFIYLLQDYQKLALTRDVLNGLYDEYDKIAALPNSYANQRKLKQLQADIDMYEEDANGRRRRLVQKLDGQIPEGRDPDTQPRGYIDVTAVGTKE